MLATGRITILGVIVSIIIACSCSNTYADPILCVDPGHGGDDVGATGCIYDYYEKHVNLQVSSDLQSTLEGLLFLTGEDVIYTRTSNLEFVPLTQRAHIANEGNVDHLISIHHNGLDPSIQRIETLYSTDTYTDDAECLDTGIPRDCSNTLATKVAYRIREWFGEEYDFRGAVVDNHKTVLDCSYMMSTISEASNIGDCDELYRFYYNTDYHINHEANAICQGWISTVTGEGIATVDYAYNGDPLPYGESLYVDITYNDIDPLETYTYAVPYQSDWVWNEEIELDADDYFEVGSEGYSFHHWEHIDPSTHWCLDSYVGDPITFSVPDDWAEDQHEFAALYTGGPYSVNFKYQIPNLVAGALYYIWWECSSGCTYRDMGNRTDSGHR